MKYAIISDTHIGLPTADLRVLEVAEHYRANGYTVVWLGDVFDLWVDPNASQYTELVFRPGDIYVMGNHDYGYRPPDWVRFYPRGLTLEAAGERWYALHGDILDFPYLFALLKQGKLPLSRIKRWAGGEYENVYRVLAAMPKEELQALMAGRFTWRLAIWLLPLLYAAIKPAQDVPTHRELTPGPLLPKNVKTIAERVLAFHQEANDARGFVLGHLHQPMRGEATLDNRPYTVQVLGAWCDAWPRTVGVLDDAGFRLEVFDA
jgi:UDP-2,3-diacylglucosamine pyrophosphatase LpxH